MGSKFGVFFLRERTLGSGPLHLSISVLLTSHPHGCLAGSSLAGREMAANPLIPSDVTVWQFTALKVMLLGSQDTSQEFIQLMLSIVCGFIQQVQCSASALLLLPGCLTFVSDESPCFPAGANLLSLEQEASFCVC